MIRILKKPIEVIGAYSAMVLGALFLAVLGLQLIVASAHGLHRHEDFLDAAIVLPIIHASPAFVYLFLLGVPFSICIVLVAMAVHSKFRSISPARANAGLIAAAICAALSLAADIPRVVAFVYLADYYQTQPELATPAFFAVSAILGGLNVAALMILGVWMVTLSWTGMSCGMLSRRVGVFGCVIGIIHVACLAVPLPNVLDIFWFPLLGIQLLRNDGFAHN